jgi:hypothetical protein
VDHDRADPAPDLTRPMLGAVPAILGQHAFSICLTEELPLDLPRHVQGGMLIEHHYVFPFSLCHIKDRVRVDVILGDR